MKVNACIRLLTIVFLTAAFPARGNGEKIEFRDRVHICHNFDTTNEIAQPAFLQVILPDKGEKTIGIGIGLKLDVVNTGFMELGLFAEYKKNTRIDKEQDVLKTGIAMEWQVLDLIKSAHSPILISMINYKKDAMQNTGSLQAALAYTHVFRGKGDKPGFPLPNTTLTIPGFLQFTYSPYLGIEYEHVNSSGADGLEGNVLRGYFHVEAALFPMGKELRQMLELTLGFIYQRDLMNTLSEKNMNYTLLKTGISCYFLKEANLSFGIGLTYVNGEDPSVGLEKQKYMEIGLRFKVN